MDVSRSWFASSMSLPVAVLSLFLAPSITNSEPALPPLTRVATATPVAPVLAVQLSGNEVLVKTLNPQKNLTYRLSSYHNGKAGDPVAASFTGRFHFATAGTRQTYSYVVQSSDSRGQRSSPSGGSSFTSGIAGTYQTSFTLSPETVAAFAQASDAYVSGRSDACVSDKPYLAAAKKLKDVTDKVTKAQPADPELLAKWSQAWKSSNISAKECTQATLIASFSSMEVASFLSGTRDFSVTLKSAWNTKGYCHVRLVAGDSKGKSGSPWITDVATAITTQPGCQRIPQFWY